MKSPYRIIFNLVAFLLLGLFLLALADKLHLHLWLNRLNGPTLDPLFRFVNFGPEFPGICLALLAGLLINFRVFFNVLLALILSSSLTHFLKHYVFTSFDRPYYFFKETENLILMQGTEMHEHFSMPSGHTSAAFAMCVSLALYSKNFTVRALLLTAAALMGYARVYMSQHFLIDVFAGAMVGVLSAAAAYYVIDVILGWSSRTE